MNSSKSTTIVVTALITFIVTSSLWLGLGGLAYFLIERDPAEFDVTVDHPETMLVGETCTLTITAGNSTSKNLSLGSIDVYDEFLVGFDVLSVKPRPNSKDGSMGFQTFYFSESLSPGDTFTLELELEATKTGTWYGDIDCCTPGESFVTSYAEIIVTEAEAP